MSYNGSGVFTINTAGQPVITGTTISSTTFNSLTADLATGLTTALTKDGQSTPTSNIGMGAFKITNLAAGTVASDAARLDQVQGGAATFITVIGTDTLTGTVVPALSAYATGNQFSFLVANTNTGAVTINVDGIGSKAITRTGTTALIAGDMVAGQAVEIIYDGTRFQLVNGNSFTNLKVSGTLGVTGVATFTAQPIVSSLTASLPVFTDASKGLVSNTMTGTGNVVMSTSPTLVTPALGTPASGVATNLTGLPLTTGVTGTLPVANGGTGVTTSTGTGAVVLGTSPTLTTPVINGASTGTGVATAATASTLVMRGAAGEITGAAGSFTTLSATGASTFTGTGKFATTIGVGNATPSASGSGITFPATQSASSDANTLDDYEEGTFTPILISTGATFAYPTQQGTYTKIGRQVTCLIRFQVSASGTVTNPTTIGDLPFTVSAAPSGGGFVTFSNMTVQPNISSIASTTTAELNAQLTAADLSPTALGISGVSKFLSCVIIYFV